MITNDWYEIELLVFDRNTWNYLAVCKQNQHLIVCKQINSNLFENKITYKLKIY